jgi:hypothetical protein
MRTYVRIIFNSEGASPQQIIPIMKELGFEESIGINDFVYKWPDRVPLSEILKLVGEMHRRLKGLQVGYEISSVT